MLIQVEDWFNHVKRSLDLPDTGLVVVTGKNGCGKSSLFVESIAYALFGKTTRGSPPNPGAKVNVRIGDISIERSRGKRETAVTWFVKKVSQGKSEGAAKAQPRINAHLGIDFETWHRTCVFSIEKVSRFTTARDSERKELIESLLGVTRFDGAVKIVRAEKAEVAQRRRSRAVEIAGVERMLEVARDDFTNAPESTSDLPDLPALRVALSAWLSTRDDMLARLPSALAEAKTARVATRNWFAAVSNADQLRRRANDKLAELEAGEACAACGRAFDVGHDHEAALVLAGKEIEMARQDHVSATKNLALAQAAESRAEAVHASVVRSEREASSEVASLEADIAAAEDRVIAAKEADDRRRALAERVEEYEVQIAGLQELDEEDGHEQDVIAGAELVLGLKGARARLLTFGLDALESHTNHALSVMGVAGRVTIAASRSKADGGVSDEIDITVDPWGGGNGYEGASGGERKRVDLAILSAVAAMHSSRLPLAFDDVFDTLDPEGVDEVALLLASLALDRPVIVITQNTALADKLQAAFRIDL